MDAIFPRHRSPRTVTRLVGLAVFALLLQVLAASGWLRADMAGGTGFSPQICGSQLPPGPDAPSPSDRLAGGGECCPFCAATAAVIGSPSQAVVASRSPVVVVASLPAAPRARDRALRTHAPRGPPTAA